MPTDWQRPLYVRWLVSACEELWHSGWGACQRTAPAAAAAGTEIWTQTGTETQSERQRAFAQQPARARHQPLRG